MPCAIREFLKNQAGNLYTSIRELTNDELHEALKVAKEYSPTNCWFVEYWMKESFIAFLEDRINEINRSNNPKNNPWR